jgi:hypothetical protein
MNGYASLAVFGLAMTSASAFFYDTTGGVFTLGALSLNSGNALALTSGTTTAFLTSGGLVAAGLGLLGLAVVKIALLSQFAGDSRRAKRSAPTQTLAQIDTYFNTIADMDVDDCGKLLVCQLETVSAEERSPEENMIASLFGESSTIDPATAKAEYDLAAYLGQATDKVACARRYARCPLDRKTIAQALAKMTRIGA